MPTILSHSAPIYENRRVCALCCEHALPLSLSVHHRRSSFPASVNYSGRVFSFIRDSFGAGAFEDEVNEEEYLQEGGMADPAGDHEPDDERFRAGTVVYISGEENNSQVAARAAR